MVIFQGIGAAPCQSEAMTDLPPLTTEELAEWAARGIPEHDAHRWYQTLGDLCGPPSAERWGLKADETPSECALSYAIYWLLVFEAADYDDAAPWLPHFPAPHNGADIAGAWRDAGWGQPGDQVRTVEDAAHRAQRGEQPPT